MSAHAALLNTALVVPSRTSPTPVASAGRELASVSALPVRASHAFRLRGGYVALDTVACRPVRASRPLRGAYV